MAFGLTNPMPRKTATSHTEELERLIKERTAELERANERLFLANQVKAEFLAHISKELRSPINRIIELADSLLEKREGELSREQRMSLARMRECGAGLRAMVDRIIELSNLNIGISRLLPKRLHVADTLREIVGGLQEMAGKKGVSIVVSCDKKPDFVTADEGKFRFILKELLTNSIKFSPKGSKIRVESCKTVLRGNGETSFLEVSVADEGPGITPMEMERIFSEFERAGNATELPGSLGIGLVLVKGLVELHGGRIRASSLPGRGSRFTFTLPLERPAAEETRRPRILLAAQSEQKNEFLLQNLKHEKYEIRTMGGGLETLSKGTTDPPDLFLLALELPDVNGIDVCLRLKSYEKTRHVPVIIIAEHAEHGERIRSLQVGVDDFFTEPLNVQELLPKIKSLVAQKLSYDFLKKSYARAEAEAYTDPMTGLCNIRHFWQHLDRELERARRYGHGCSIALIDIDFFKKYNDSYGHLQGDEVLREAAELLRQQIRNSDIAARYGGEEFVIIMPETSKELAMVVGEKLRKAFETFSFPLQETQPGGSLTISVGIATFPQDAKGARDLFDKADKALYRAKEEGRNRVVGWGVCLFEAGSQK